MMLRMVGRRGRRQCRQRIVVVFLGQKAGQSWNSRSRVWIVAVVVVGEQGTMVQLKDGGVGNDVIQIMRVVVVVVVVVVVGIAIMAIHTRRFLFRCGHIQDLVEVTARRRGGRRRHCAV